MNKKEYPIWKEIKYDEYLIEGHIFSYEKQLKHQGKIVLNYVVYDSDEANKTYDDLFNQKKFIKKPQINLNPYDNKNHPLWSFHDPYLYDEDYMEATLYEIELEKEGKPIMPFQNDEHVTSWH